MRKIKNLFTVFPLTSDTKENDEETITIAMIVIRFYVPK